VILFVAENVDTGSCTRKEQREVSFTHKHLNVTSLFIECVCVAHFPGL